MASLIQARSKKEIRARLDEIGAYTGLNDYVLFPLRTYSNGMLARLAFTLATACKNPILLMDECMGASDSDSLQIAHDRLVACVSDVHLFVLANHNTVLLKSICNRAVVLKKERDRVRRQR